MMDSAVMADPHNDDPRSSLYYYSRLYRILAGEYEDKDVELDYTVLTVAVLTLGLLMVVEFARHKLDQAATGRPFFKTVLEGMYRECKLLFVHLEDFFFSF